MNTITATITRCRDGKPLVELRDQPFNGLEVRPDELRELARKFIALADMAERSGRHFTPTRVTLGVM